MTGRLRYILFRYRNIPGFFWRLARKARHFSGYWRFKREYFGRVAQPSFERQPIWLHGNINSDILDLVPLIEALRSGQPGCPLFLTTAHPMGRELIQREFGNLVPHAYAPFDLPGAVCSFLDRVTPKILIATNDWFAPIMCEACGSRGIPVMLVNVRKFPHNQMARMLDEKSLSAAIAAIRLVAATGESGLQDLHKFGVPDDRCTIVGDTRYDHVVTGSMRELAAKLARQVDAGNRKIIVAGSIHHGEIPILLGALSVIKKAFPATLLVLAMRFPEEIRQFHEACSAKFRVARRTLETRVSDSCDILLVDTIGELRWIYGIADVSFVGGSFLKVGGHNLLEPVIWGCPTLSGPDRSNNPVSAHDLEAAGLVRIVDRPGHLGQAVVDLVKDDGMAHGMSDNMRTFLGKREHATTRLLTEVQALLEKA